MSEPATYEGVGERLEALAGELVADRRCPIVLDPLLARYDLRLRLLRQGGWDSAGALVERPGGGREIVVYRSASVRAPLRTRERFTIAHELAHEILERWGVPRPASRAEYWQLEEECNRFAAALLVPPRAVEFAVRPRPADSAKLYGRLRLVAERARVSRETACRRIVPRIDGCSAFEVRPMVREDGVVAKVVWRCETIPLLDMNAPGHIHADHVLGQALSDCANWTPGIVDEVPVGELRLMLERRAERIWAVALMPSTDAVQTTLFDAEAPSAHAVA